VSNFLAIANTTAAIVQLVQTAVGADVPGATVTTTRPELLDSPAGPTVNVFLYQVTPSLARRNDDLPTRRTNGAVIQRPQAALDLHYLFTFHGDDAQLEPQRLLGSVARTLEAQPALTAALITDAVNAQQAILGASNLAAQGEPLRITQASLTLEEMSKLWSVFFQTTYVLSTAYTCQTVIIESDDVPAPALPVRDRSFAALPYVEPVITAIAPAVVTAGTALTLTVANLDEQSAQVDFGGTAVAPTSTTPGQIGVTPPATIAAGIVGVRVLQNVRPDPKSASTVTIASDAVPLVVRPTVTGPALQNVTGAGNDLRSATFVCTVAPALGAAQRASVLLVQTQPAAGAAPQAYAIDVPPRAAGSAAMTKLSVPCTGLVPGTYLVRLSVDGVESVLGLDANGKYASPAVTLA
jgi:hypothetical protein